MTGRLVRLFLVAGAISTFLLIPTTQARPLPLVPVIVRLSAVTNLPLVKALLGGILVDSIPGTNTYLFKLPALPILTPVLSLLGVQFIEADAPLSLQKAIPAVLTLPAHTVPDWYRVQPALQLVRAGGAQAYSTGQGVTVADINSSVDYAHPALAGHLTGGYDFVLNTSDAADVLQNGQGSSGFLDEGDSDILQNGQGSSGFLDEYSLLNGQGSSGFLDQPSRSFLSQASAGLLGQGSSGFLDNPNVAYSHGTLCAGLIAAVAPNASIMPIRAFDDEGNTDLFTLAKSIHYARTHGAQVINMSFGTLTNSKAIKEAVDAALKANIVLVASAGNNNTSAAQYPASYAGVIGVAATDLWDTKGSFSNFGNMVVVDAPGVNVISAYPNNQYSIASGTSFSAPIVAGTAAMVRSLKASGVKNAVTGSAVNIDSRNPQYAGKLGYGRIDAIRAVRQ